MPRLPYLENNNFSVVPKAFSYSMVGLTASSLYNARPAKSNNPPLANPQIAGHTLKGWSG